MRPGRGGEDGRGGAGGVKRILGSVVEQRGLCASGKQSVRKHGGIAYHDWERFS